MKRILYNKVKALVACCCFATVSAVFSACSDVSLPASPAASLAKVQHFSYVTEGRNVLLRWQLPNGRLQAVRVFAGNNLVAELEATATSYTVVRPKADVEQAYTVKLVYADGLVSEGSTVRFTVEGLPARIGYLIPENSIQEIQDDDEQAAARWFVSTYATTGDVLTPADIERITPEEYSVIWIQVDRKYIGRGWQRLPQPLVSDAMIGALSQYVKEGGNLLLTKFATQLLVPIGRLPEIYAPNIFGDGDGGVGTDNWVMNALLGNDMPVQYDYRSHKLFEGMEKGSHYGYAHEVIPLEGPGEREDHNCMWDYNAFGFDGNPNVVVNFEQATNSTTLAVWGHVRDFCVGGIVDFHPSGDFTGRCLAIGLSAYEWNENGTVNIFQGNIERLTSNSIDYMK